MKIISKDLRDGEKLPERHVFNGMGYQGDNISPHLRRQRQMCIRDRVIRGIISLPIWRGTMYQREPKVLL